MEEFKYGDFLNCAKIQKGEVIDVASDLFSILLYCRERNLKFDSNRLIDMMQELVGSEGTVMIRTFTWNFCKGKPFDIRHSLSQVGALGNCALRRDDFVRTRHPIYSWAVWGKYANVLRQYDNKDGFDEESIFQFLYDHNARQINLGNMSHTAMTINHHAEVRVGVPYRKKKVFRSDYIDDNGECEKREYSMYVRPLNISVEGTPFESTETQKMLEDRGIRTTVLFDNCLNVIAYNVCGVVNFVIDDLVNNDGKNYVEIDGKRGVRSSGVDLKSAQY